MTWINNIVAKLLGKQVGDKIGLSKAKLTAVIFVIIIGTQEISKAFGHPIIVPEWMINFLKAAGLWAIRDAIATK